MISYLLAIIVGISFGIITGITPGIHINTITAILLSLLGFFLNLEPILILIFIVAMATTHTFLNFIPSIFLGSPDEDTGLSVLPGHELLLKGAGYSAVVYTLYGSLIALVLILIFTPLFTYFLPKIYPSLRKVIFLIILFASIYLIYSEKKSRIWAFIVFMLAGFLGVATLNLSMKNPLLPLLTGLFGSSSLITSIMKKQRIPEQKIKQLREIKITKKDLANSSLASVLAAPLCSCLPSLGSNQAAIIGSDIVQDLTKKEFLILLGCINTIVTGLSFIVLYSISTTRTGAAVAVDKIIELSSKELLIILGVILISGIISFIIALTISKIFAKIITKINYNKLSIFILSFLFLVSFYFSGFLGIIVFVTASFTGLATILLGIRRSHLMGSLMVSTILFYFPI